ncbi:ATP-binding protein [Yinghuangia sp. YIM S10712]|uniref:ATP-binding protein n=1 Tax=Yinghuangia sp. YIM S10712 TaxID=3436930 RepID=UPI003F52D9C9
MRAAEPATTVLLHELLDPVPTAASQARRLTKTACRGLISDAYEVVLVVDELVTNAVIHGLAQPIHLWIYRSGSRLWVEVDNASHPWPGLALVTRPDDDMPCGRGLLIALSLCKALQVHVNQRRTVVSAAFATTP